MKRKQTAGFTVAAMIFLTALSKLLGMVRQMLIAETLADTVEGIAFAAASKIPFSIFDILFSAAILGSFLPIYRGTLQSDEGRAKRFSSAFFTAVTAGTAVLSLLGVIFAREILFLCAPKLEGETAVLATSLLRIMFPSVIFAGAAYTLVGVMQSHEKFILPSLISGVSNLVIIGALLILPRESGVVSVYGLSVAHLLSWMTQFLTLVPSLIRSRHFPRPTAVLNNPDLYLALKRSLPVMLGSWLIPVISLSATFFSSFAKGENGGAIVVFDYAFSVFAILSGVLTYGICNFLFPKLSEKAATGDKDGFSASVGKGLFVTLLLILPVAAATYFLAYEGISLLYQRGNFSEALAMSTADALRALAFAMPAFCLFEFLSRTYYACGKVKVPMAAAAVGIGTQTAFSLAFLLTNTLSPVTVTACTALSLWGASLTLLILLPKCLGAFSIDAAAKKVALLFLSFALSAMTMGVFHRFWVKNHAIIDFFEKFLAITIVFLVGLVVYLLCIRLFRLAGIPAPKRKDGE